MMHQQVMTDEGLDSKVYDFMEYKKKKPFYLKPIKITTLNETYHMVKNVVFQGKQILALKTEQDPNTVVLVEAIIEDGHLINLSMLSDECMEDVSRMLVGII
ncbi:hypothetical protein COJ96_02115 [Bacillus sp. AFS073361]|uniref:hypothetical protein n=1 Tax=Bacillus sp. AFS073361 TaxID=2033511 RepID=UPI000BF484F7|nr:hypothetical protein [Bacillus sp. AFS073361]PFP30780.1 hypothetical protein COJ96_02115 [Bacillus sp. AFS073361]